MKKEVVVLVFGMFLAQAASAQSSAGPAPPKSGAGAAPQANSSASAGKTAGEVMKNVQVLKDVPASQWNGVMAFIAGSLGVGCEHCHAQPFDSDAKKAKQTARSMMKMVREINASNFGGRSEITCNTCHRGSLQPRAMPSLWDKTPDEVAAYKKQQQADQTVTAQPSPPAAAPAQPLPSADKVFAAYRQAVGSGPWESTHITATTVGDIQPARTIDIDMVLPDKILVRVATPAGENRFIANGDHGWLVTPQVRRDLSPLELENIRKGFADQFQPLKQTDAEASGKVTGTEKIGNRTYTVVEARLSTGLKRLYFDAQSGLLYRAYSEISVADFGTTPVELTYDDYRNVNGVEMPFTMTARSPGDRAVMKISVMQSNVVMDPARFDPPASAPAPPR